MGREALRESVGQTVDDWTSELGEVGKIGGRDEEEWKRRVQMVPERRRVKMTKKKTLRWGAGCVRASR